MLSLRSIVFNNRKYVNYQLDINPHSEPHMVLTLLLQKIINNAKLSDIYLDRNPNGKLQYQ